MKGNCLAEKWTAIVGKSNGVEANRKEQKLIQEIGRNCFFFYFGLGFQFRDLPPGSTAANVTYCTIPRLF